MTDQTPDPLLTGDRKPGEKQSGHLEPDQRPHQASKADIEAVDWLLRLTEMASDSEGATAAREEVQDEFNLWATGSSANLRSFIETLSVFEVLGECEAELIHELVAHVDSGRIKVDSGGMITPLRPPVSGAAVAESAAHGVPNKERVRRSWQPMSAVAATLVFIAVGVLFWHWAEGTAYGTQAGEWRRVRLEDGSVVFLSELSEIRVSYSAARRTIDLLRGQALFDVARDARRPLWVRSDTAEIQALGTRFGVDHRNGPTRVTVVDGSVRLNTTPGSVLPWIGLRDMTSTLMRQGSKAHSLLLTKEQGAEIAGQAITPSDPTQVENDVAAQSDEVMFDHQPLSAVAARFNLDNRRQIQIADAAAGQTRISGRYKTDHPDKLVLTFPDLHPELAVQETDDGWVVHERTPWDGAK